MKVAGVVGGGGPGVPTCQTACCSEWFSEWSKTQGLLSSGKQMLPKGSKGSIRVQDILMYIYMYLHVYVYIYIYIYTRSFRVGPVYVDI